MANFHLIDLDHWGRKPYFEHYFNAVPCTYSMTANIDITALLCESKQKKLKVYPALIYLLSTVVNAHREFCTSFDENGALGYWDSMNPSYTVFHPEDETFSCIWTVYHENFSTFYAAYLEDVKTYGAMPGLAPKLNEPANTFPLSCIPWFSFTGFNLNVYPNTGYLRPIFTIGKYFKQGGKMWLPLSAQVHHAVCDGYHLGRFLNEVQALAFAAPTWLTVS